jgi:hypothetical protein
MPHEDMGAFDIPNNNNNNNNRYNDINVDT